MSHLFYLILFTLVLFALPSAAQKKWDGGGASEQWSDPLNWTGNTLPASNENVVLDNSIVTVTYRVILPTTAVTVKSLVIGATGSNTVELVLPKENKTVPALTIPGPGYGLIINSGGVFKNSSGATTGTPVVISDSIQIKNDGRLIINTPRAHATNVDRLSRAPGTERGIVEFDIPDASTTISLSGRNYGRLILRAASWGTALNYTAAGTSRVVIRSDLEIGQGVNFNLNFSDTIFVYGDIKQEQSTFNLGNTSRSVVLAVAGNITQSPEGLITETGTGIQQILLNGNVDQQLNVQGQILNQVSLVKNGPSNARLQANLALPFLLSLKRGAVISTATSLLTLLAGCNVIVDSLSDNSYIDGPLRKMGLNNNAFLFPVGKRDQLRWMQLTNATGDFTAEYFHANPTLISPAVGSGINHISSVEYWNISADNGAMANVKLSFSDPHSGGVTDLTHLRVARFQNSIWENTGNTDFRGTPGSNGWVSSSAAGGFSAENNFFALASAISQENPLPFSEIKLSAGRISGNIIFKWSADADDSAKSFELQESPDNVRYKCIYNCPTKPGQTIYQYKCEDTINAVKYYRVQSRNADSLNNHLSKTIKLIPEPKQTFIMNTLYVRNQLNLRISLMENKKLDLLLYNTTGHVIKKIKVDVHKGTTSVKISVAELTQGPYFLVILHGYNRLFTSKFIKGA